MNDFSVFAHDLRQRAGVARALYRLDRDFGLNQSLVIAAAWLGRRGVPPDPVLAAELVTSISPEVGASTLGHTPTSQDEKEERHVVPQALCEALALAESAGSTETVAGWFLLVAPQSVTCVEQSRWLETIRNACLQLGR